MLRRQCAFIAPGQALKLQSQETMNSQSPFNSGKTYSFSRTLKKLKSTVSNNDDVLYDEEEHYYDEIDVLVQHID